MVVKMPQTLQQGVKSSFGGRGDKVMSRLVFAVSMAGILLMVFILGFLVYNGLPVLKESSIKEIG